MENKVRTTEHSDAMLPAGDGCDGTGDGVPFAFDDWCDDVMTLESRQLQGAAPILVFYKKTKHNSFVCFIKHEKRRM